MSLEENTTEFDEAFAEFSGENATDAPEEQGAAPEAAESEQEITAQGEEPEQQETEIDYKAELEKMTHRFNSVNGRVSAYQRQISELQSQKAQPQKPESIDDSQWHSLKEDYPDIAEALDSKFNQMSEQYEQRNKYLEDQLDFMRQKSEEDFVDSQRQLMEKRHPDCYQVAQSQQFNQWLDAQPQPVKELRGSQIAADNIWLLDNFKRDFQISQTADDGIQRKRDAQLRSAQTMPSRSRNSKPDMGKDDFDSAWDYFTQGS